jgi:hypothetical protein
VRACGKYDSFVFLSLSLVNIVNSNAQRPHNGLFLPITQYLLLLLAAPQLHLTRPTSPTLLAMRGGKQPAKTDGRASANQDDIEFDEDDVADFWAHTEEHGVEAESRTQRRL